MKILLLLSIMTLVSFSAFSQEESICEQAKVQCVRNVLARCEMVPGGNFPSGDEGTVTEAQCFPAPGALRPGQTSEDFFAEMEQDQEICYKAASLCENH